MCIYFKTFTFKEILAYSLKDMCENSIEDAITVKYFTHCFIHKKIDLRSNVYGLYKCNS